MKKISGRYQIGIIFLFKFWSIQAQGLNDTDGCDVDKNCGSDISEERCIERNCCYIGASPTRLYQCVQKRIPAPNDFGEEFRPLPPPSEESLPEALPPDAIQLSHHLKQNLDRFKQDPNLSPFRALNIVDQLQNYLRYKAEEGDPIDWWYQEKGMFNARIKADPDNFNGKVDFESGTVVQVKRPNGKPLSGIAGLILVEYFTIGNVWKKLDQNFATRIEESRDSCRKTFRVTDTSTVLSVVAFDQRWEEVKISLDVSVKQKLKRNFEEENKKLICDTLNEVSERWSGARCTSSGLNGDSISCDCNFANLTRGFVHSSVASLEFVENTKPFSNIQITEVSMESLAFGSLSITLLGLVLTLRKRSKSVTSASVRIKERTVVHINFVVALTALHLTNLINEVIYMEDLLCKLTVVFSQYFTLASAMWMLMECLTLYINITKKKTKHTYLRCIKLLTSWGIPAVIIIISAAIGLSAGTYVNIRSSETLCTTDDLRIEQPFSNVPRCSLSTEKHMIWAVAAPLLVIFVSNFFMMAHIIGFVMWLNMQSKSLKFSKHKSQGIHVWHATKGILVLIPILGLPWLIGYFLLIFNYQVDIAFQYAHVIMNGLQGVTIFILYCGLNQEVYNIFRKVPIKKIRQNKMAKIATTTARPRMRRKSTGGQINHAQPYYNLVQRPRSASCSTNSTHFRWKTKRSYSFASTDPLNLDGIQAAWSRKSLAGFASNRSVCADSRPSLIPGLNLERGEPTMISFSYDEDMVKSQTLPTMSKLRWHRVIPKDFKRFSVIPEELRRGGGIESLVIENSDAFSNRKSREIEVLEVDAALNRETVKVDVHMQGRVPRVPFRNHKISKMDSRRDLSSKLAREKLKQVKLRFRDSKIYDVRAGRRFDCYEV